MKKVLFILAFICVSIVAFAGNDVKRPDTYNYNRALEELNNGNTEDALEYFGKEIAANPKSGYAHFWVAYIYASDEEYGKALSSLSKALNNIPKKDKEFLASTYDLRANVYLSLEDTLKALDDYATALKANPQDEDVYMHRAQIYYEQEKYDLANADYEKVKQLDQGNTLGYVGIARNYIAQEKWDEAVKELSYAINLDKTNSQAYAFRAECYVGQKDWARATDDIISSLLIDQNNKAFNVMLDMDDAAFDTMVSKLKIQSVKNPNEDSWPCILGLLHENKKKYSKAIEYYKKANDIDVSPFNYSRMSKCYGLMGDFSKQLDYISKACEMDSTEMSYVSAKGNALLACGEVDKAIAEYSACIDDDPEDDSGYYYRAWAKMMKRDFEGAVEDLSMAVSLAPEASVLYNTRGEAYLKLGKKELADEDFKKVVELEKEPDLYNCVYYAYMRLGQNDKAIEVLDTVIARAEKEYLAGEYYNAACLYSRMENKAKALEYLEKSFEGGYKRFNDLKLDYDMDYLRETKEYKDLVEKYESKLRFDIECETAINGEEVVTEVPFTKENGICNVKCQINGLPLYFIFDTGASTVSLSMVEATFMMKNGYLSSKDVVGSQYFTDANGNVSAGTVINLREVNFGGQKLENVKASVVRNQKAPLLLGQTVLSRLGKIEIDNSKAVLRITGRK